MSSHRKPGQAAIAERLGVSISAVSRALANEAGVSESLRSEVHRLAASLGYRNKHSSPASSGQRAVALVPLDSATSGMSGFYVGIVDGMRAAAVDAGLTLDVRLVRDAQLDLPEIQAHARQSGARCILLAGIDAWDELLDWCQREGLIAVLVNGTDPLMRVSSVAPANTYGAQMATRRLLEAGHRRILHYTHPWRPTILDRRKGFESAMAEFADAEPWVLSTAEFPARDLLSAILAQGRGTTAVFCWNDLAAVSLLESVKAAGAGIPEGFSIMGFDNLPLASMTTPRLSTINVDREAIGRAAIRLTIEHLQGETAVKQVEIGVTNIAGETVRNVRA